MHVRRNHCCWLEVPTGSEEVSLERVWLFLYDPLVVMKLEAPWKEWGTWVCSDRKCVSKMDFSWSGFKCWMMVSEKNEIENKNKSPEDKYSQAMKLDWKKSLFANNQVLARLLCKPRVNRFVITGDGQQELCKNSVFKWKVGDRIWACWDEVLLTHFYLSVGWPQSNLSKLSELITICAQTGFLLEVQTIHSSQICRWKMNLNLRLGYTHIWLSLPLQMCSTMWLMPQ